MPILASDSGVNFTPPPAGLTLAVCCDVIDRGLVKGKFGEKHKVVIRWQLEDVNPANGKRWITQKTYTCSLNERATLRKDLETWRGRKFSPEELKGFDLEKLIGVSCQVQISHAPGDDGRTFANVDAVLGLAKGQHKLTTTEYVREKDRNGATQPELVPDTDETVPF